jgi:hypothetical protein
MSIESRAAGLAELPGLSIADRILGLYEMGIEACAARRRDDAAMVLVELMAALDLDYGEIAAAFHRLYEFCLGKVGQGDFPQVAWVLQDLHDAWREAAADPSVTGAPPSAASGWR